MSDVRDEDLLERFTRGDSRAFEALVRRHEDRVFSICLGVTRDRNDALDAAQDTFLAVYRRAASFRRESAFSTWLYQVALNASRDLLRKKTRQRTLVDTAEAPPPAAAPDDAVVRRLDLASALLEIPEQYREAVVMHDLGGVPYETIAATLGVPDGTVKSRISRGRRHLAQLLEQGAQGGRQTQVMDREEG